MKVDPRITTLAETLIHYSLELKAGETVFIDMNGDATRPLAEECVRVATACGAIPYWQSFDNALIKPFFSGANEKQHVGFAAMQANIMDQCDAYIGIRGQANPFALGDMPENAERLKRQHYWQKVHLDTRMKKRWVVMRYPTDSMALAAQKSLEAFEDFYFQVCNLDYAKMAKAMLPLKELMEKTDRVRLVAPGTDLSFSIKDIPVITCDGKVNIPDGEVFTAPVRDSVNGTICYNTSSFYDGDLFANITFKIEAGKIIEATCPGNPDHLNKILDTDDGARYFGEFAIAVNPYIAHAMNDILFDEKIHGSIHLTPGNSYKEAFNGNESAVHWDLVLVQRPDYGGGEMYFDDVLVRKDGLFVIDALKGLNPEALRK